MFLGAFVEILRHRSLAKIDSPGSIVAWQASFQFFFSVLTLLRRRVICRRRAFFKRKVVFKGRAVVFVRAGLVRFHLFKGSPSIEAGTILLSMVPVNLN